MRRRGLFFFVLVALLALLTSSWRAAEAPARGDVAVPAVAVGRAPDPPASAPLDAGTPEDAHEWVVTLVDEAGVRAAGGDVTGATPRDGRYILTGAAFACAEVYAPGFLVTELCADGPSWGPGERTVVLERARKVQVLCDEGAGPAKCEGKLLFRCLSRATPDFGRCEEDRCDCPDGPESVVTSMRKPFKGEVAAVIEDTAVFRHTVPGTLVVAGPWAQGAALVLRQVGDQTFPATFFPDGEAAAPVELPAGTFSVSAFGAEGRGLELRDIVIRARETTRVNLGPPEGAVVRVIGSPMVVVLRSAARRWTYRPWGDPLDLPVPPGGHLTVATDAGCCTWTAPASPLECVPDATAACAGLFDGAMAF